MKYIGFRSHSGRSTFQPQSPSVVLSLELEIAVVALLTTLTCDQSTQSVVHVQETDKNFFQKVYVHQFDSAGQETMKLLGRWQV